MRFGNQFFSIQTKNPFNFCISNRKLWTKEREREKKIWEIEEELNTKEDERRKKHYPWWTEIEVDPTFLVNDNKNETKLSYLSDRLCAILWDDQKKKKQKKLEKVDNFLFYLNFSSFVVSRIDGFKSGSFSSINWRVS